MNSLPTWMRRALFATAGMNVLAAAGFLPAATSMRALAGLPEGHPLYLMTVAMFVQQFITPTTADPHGGQRPAVAHRLAAITVPPLSGVEALERCIVSGT